MKTKKPQQKVYEKAAQALGAEEEEGVLQKRRFQPETEAWNDPRDYEARESDRAGKGAEPLAANQTVHAAGAGRNAGSARNAPGNEQNHVRADAGHGSI